MTIATPKRLTIEEYLGYDDGTDTPYMLRDGVLVTMGAESDRNVSVAMFLISIFLQVLPYSLLRRGTEIAVPGTNAETRYPDLMVLTEECRSALAGAKRSLITFEMPAPALVVEVVSNSEQDKASRDRDYEDKRTEYAGRGIPEYWIVDPVKQVVLVLTLVDDAYEAVEFMGEQAIVSQTFSELTLTTTQILAAGE
ncbi:Uma2 family endonuclease [filamentous cyanobacterium LEGE 11480]|uniref:Uma2 family endonuclease n=1 Tax=Romeriopsis navalis LEGE 11480 TaxID=2777977 RepID=A0A928Z5W0_9CYAN|nr:Uma2 family endonuclease [Romeriopsis navalis]MBE9031923.1 Uma2 family endonuclease [Romeriopsis navalis LEGE 11480]